MPLSSPAVAGCFITRDYDYEADEDDVIVSGQFGVTYQDETTF